MSLRNTAATGSLAALFSLALPLVLGCSGDDDPPPDASAGAGAAAGFGGAGASGGSAGSGGASAGTGGSAGSGAAGKGGSGGGAGTAGSAGSGGFTQEGVCGWRGEGTASTTEFSGFEEYYLIGDEGFGDDICIVRFDATKVAGEPQVPCPEECQWSHVVELSNPTIIEDVNGVCANSELGFDAERIAELDGARFDYGYVFEYAGHNSVLMKYFENRGIWDAAGNATWDEALSEYHFDSRNGVCLY